MLTADDEILIAIEEFRTEHGYPPTFRDLAERLGHPVMTVHYHLCRLRERGQVSWVDRKPRTLKVEGEYREP